ncbi:MAG: EAL domain-containing protein, partial [Eubacterium sp.]|nr:EAL domain-containing protein [Eubacterium sp.]
PEIFRSIFAAFPISVAAALAILVNIIIWLLTDATGFNALFSMLCTNLFSSLGSIGVSGAVYMFLTGVLWFFGIHGSNVLGFANGVFEPAIDDNIAAIAAGSEPAVIATKTFMDVFALMGGSGCTLCLVIAIFLFSDSRSNERLARISLLPMLFNINEPILFGLPVIYNPSLLVPFILTPLVNYLVSYAAMAAHLVPVTIARVEWTTPIFLSGYLATGSAAGVVLQLVNLTIGVFIYRPFIISYEKKVTSRLQSQYQTVVRVLRAHEKTNSPIVLTKEPGDVGYFSRGLVTEISAALSNRLIQMYYQPQFNNDNEVVGVEALMRWNYEPYGMMYPPLIIKAAEENGKLFDLESYAWDRAMEDYYVMKRMTGKEFILSLNTTVTTLVDDRFEETMSDLVRKHRLRPEEICIEVTEQTELTMDDQLRVRLSSLKKTGFHLAIDDFAMGFTSVKYLQDNFFDDIKLDGSLTRNIMDNKNAQDIIDSMAYMSRSLDFKITAEYVETEEQKERLQALGCEVYQGFLYSPAVPRDDMIRLVGRSEYVANREDHDELRR